MNLLIKCGREKSRYKMKMIIEKATDIMYNELREKFFHLIAGSFAHHEDDYPDVENTADDAIELVKEFIQKLTVDN